MLVKGGEAEAARGGSVIGLAVNLSALLAVLLRPYMPATSADLQAQLNLGEEAFVIADHAVQLLAPGHKIGQVPPQPPLHNWLRTSCPFQPKPLFAKLEAAQAAEFQARFAGSQEERKASSKGPLWQWRLFAVTSLSYYCEDKPASPAKKAAAKKKEAKAPKTPSQSHAPKDKKGMHTYAFHCASQPCVRQIPLQPLRHYSSGLASLTPSNKS